MHLGKAHVGLVGIPTGGLDVEQVATIEHGSGFDFLGNLPDLNELPEDGLRPIIFAGLRSLIG